MSQIVDIAAERLLERLAAMADAVPGHVEAVLAEVDDWHGAGDRAGERLLPRLRRNAARWC